MFPAKTLLRVSSDKTETESKLDWQQQKELQAKERKRKNASEKDRGSDRRSGRAGCRSTLLASPEVTPMLANVSN